MRRKLSISAIASAPLYFDNITTHIKVLNMDNESMIHLNKSKQQSDMLQNHDKEKMLDNLIQRKDSREFISANNIYDEKDLLIAQLQEQVTKQRECISYYESIVQLMNYRLMKLKKVLKAHQLLEGLD